MRILSIFTIAALAATSGAFAMAPVTVGTVGNAGYLTINIEDTGHVTGDDATFHNGIGAATTIWNMDFGFLVDGATYEVASYTYSGANYVTAPAATAVNATTVTNTLTFDNANLTAGLQVVGTAPAAGNTAQVVWTFTFNNSGATAITVRPTTWVDVDSYLTDNLYDNDLVGFTNLNGGSIAVGEANGSGGINLDSGVLISTNPAPAALVGISEGAGSSYYWSSSAPFTTKGASVNSGAIETSIRNKIVSGAGNADANNDYISDAGQDSGGALEGTVLTVPASGSVTYTVTALWGSDTDVTPNSFTVTAVNDWSMY